MDYINQIVCGDALELCNQLPPHSIDMILADLPYGSTDCAWDEIIPLVPMWTAFKNLIKSNGAIVLTSSQPFTSLLVSSNLSMFRHEWMWDKTRVTGYLDANKKPLKAHENILVFAESEPRYYPQLWWAGKKKSSKGGSTEVYGKNNAVPYKSEGWRYPTSVLRFSMPARERGLHPTQKPLALFEYLIKTYSQEGDIIFDPCVGSGTTALAAHRTNRNYICGDNNLEYVGIAQERLAAATPFEPPLIQLGMLF